MYGIEESSMTPDIFNWSTCPSNSICSVLLRGYGHWFVGSHKLAYPLLVGHVVRVQRDAYIV